MNHAIEIKLARSPQEIARLGKCRTPVTLTYETRSSERALHGQRRLKRWSLFAALFCGVAPILSAAIGLAVWLLLRTNVIAAITAIAIAAGVLMIPLGGGFLVKHYLADLRQLATPAERRRHRKLFWLSGILLAANLPVAIGCAAIADHFNAVYLITVRNDSKVSVADMTLQIGGRNVRIPALPPMTKTKFECPLVSYSSIFYQLTLAGKPLAGECEDPDNHAMAPMADPIVIIHDDGVTVEEAEWGTLREHF